MNVANKTLCEKLYKLSGWNDTDKIWFPYYDLPQGVPEDPSNPPPYWQLTDKDGGSIVESENIPAYDLGFLIRKLPSHMRVEFYKRVPNDDGSYSWGIEAGDIGGNTWYVEDDDTPENALCKLAIELFEQNILTRKEQER